MPIIFKDGRVQYSIWELRDLPTISQGHTDNLKVQTENKRVWLSRCTIEDGEPYNNKVTEEELINGSWVTTATYKAIS